jgi:hypothetical protein
VADDGALERPAAVRFSAVVELGGKTATGIPVPEEVLQGLGAGKRVAVRATVNGYTYRTTTGSVGGRTMLPLSAEHRSAASVSAGDTVDVDIEVDTEPRDLVVPADLAEALAARPEAQRFFESLSYSNRRRHVLAVEGAKAEATRRRRVEAVVDKAAAQQL